MKLSEKKIMLLAEHFKGKEKDFAEILNVSYCEADKCVAILKTWIDQNPGDDLGAVFEREGYPAVSENIINSDLD